MSRPKSIAALAAVTAAVAIAAPTATANAATTAPVSRAATVGLVPGSLPCRLLLNQVTLAYASGNLLWASFVSNIFVRSGCGGAAI